MTPILLATHHNHLNIVMEIIEIGKVNLYAQCNKLNNVLHYAVQTHNQELIKFVVSCDAENNQLRRECNFRGLKPFDYDLNKSY